ncbi:50S ribosomal protein L13 [Patescibacteria group bacterium]|nr:50S ribosomal protein L13 [Patescibacteria group bacterium]
MERKIHKIDATEISLGRLSTKIADLLRGKLKVSYLPYVDGGDFVVVSNVDKIKITGKKLDDKKYYHYSGYPGGMKETAMKNKSKEDVLRNAVLHMLPDNKLRKNMIKRLSFSK